MKPSCIKAIVKKDGLAAVRNKLILLGLVWGIVVGPAALMIALGIYVWRVRSR